MNKILLSLFVILIGLSSCENDKDNTDVAELQKQIDELTALLESQRSITKVVFEGNEMVLTFANGSTVRTAAPTNIIPYIGENGNWWVNGEDLGVKAEAQVPTVGSNGNWWVGDTDTGVRAAAADGVDGVDGTGIDKVDYDPETAILKITLSDGTIYEFQLFYEDAVQGIKLGDLNGKYLLKGITNGDFPFAEFLYNSKNQLTDINYFVSLLNAPVKNASVHRTYGTNDKIETQSLIEYAIKDKAVQVGYSFPNSSYDWNDDGWDDTNELWLTADDAFAELFPSGVANFTGTPSEFFTQYREQFYQGIKKGNYVYDIHKYYVWDEVKQEETYSVFVTKRLIRTDNTKTFAITEVKGQKCIWTPPYHDWDGEQQWGDYEYEISAFVSSDIVYNAEGYFDIQANYSSYDIYYQMHPAVAYSSVVDEVTTGSIKDYIAFDSESFYNPENITGTYKVLYKEYNRYQKGDEINRVSFAYSYNGSNQTTSNEGENLYKLMVSNNKIDAIVRFDGTTEVEVLRLNYVDGRLASISSPEHNVNDIVKVLYDAENNPREFQVNSKDLAGKDMGELLANLGLAYRTDVYDEELGMVVEKYVYPNDYTPLLKVKYDYTMKNFMNHTVTAINPLYTVFNSENAIQELIWAGHGSCFFAEYMDYNEGGYPQKVKGYLQLSPFYEYGDDTEHWDDYDQNDSFEYPINGSVATSYKLQYQKISE